MNDEIPISEVQKYWDARPCNVRHSDAPVGSFTYFEEVRARKYTVEPHIPKFAQFPRWRGKHVLELGCGIGTDTIEFALHGARVTAVDISSESLAIAQKRAQVYEVEHMIRFVLADAEELLYVLFPDNYDLVYSFGVLHHTPYPEFALFSIQQICAKHTPVKLMLYNRLSAKAFALTRGALWNDKAIAQHSEAQTGCPVTYAYTPWEARQFLSQWLNVQRVKIDHIFPYKLQPYLNYVYDKHWWARVPGFELAEKLVGWHLLIDATVRG